MRLDLHCHSTHSDGSFGASDVATMAGDFGVELFCLTDHDTCAGFEETDRVLQGGSCRVLRGLELSCKEYGKTVHLLMYGLHPGPGLDALNERLDAIAEQRKIRLRLICDKLDRLGVHLDADKILARTHGRTPGRPDVARALVESGTCSGLREAFTRFLRDDGPAYVAVDRVTVREGLELGRAAGARVSLAHPHAMREHALVRDLFVRHREAGLEGIEARYGRYGKAEAEGWMRLAREFDLVVTAGSDFHGDMTPDIARPGVVLEDPFAERLLAWLS